MNLFELYCVYCARAFLNAASLLVIVYPDREPKREQIAERGYQTIRKITKELDDNPDSYLEINQDRVDSRMRAETFVQGTAVCMDHIWAADMKGYVR